MESTTNSILTNNLQLTISTMSSQASPSTHSSSSPLIGLASSSMISDRSPIAGSLTIPSSPVYSTSSATSSAPVSPCGDLSYSSPSSESKEQRARCTRVCISVVMGIECRNGDACTWAHSMIELNMHRACRFGSECRNRGQGG